MMENFIQKIKIDKVRHLSDINITLSESERKHLILTGKNGSGKTSVLESMKSFLSMYPEGKSISRFYRDIALYKESIKMGQDDLSIRDTKRYLKELEVDLQNTTQGIQMQVPDESDIIDEYEKGQFIIAYYAVDRQYRAEKAEHIEKVTFQQNYAIDDAPSRELIKYLLDLKTTQALAEKAMQNEKSKKSEEIDQWFDKFEKLLQMIFDDETLRLDFNIETFEFSILTKDREPFGFNQMSSGYSAVLEIVVDLMLRMEKSARGFYNLQGIVLIDELETHLHLDLQKKIFPFLTQFFPKIQFIVTTHSPFILNSAENAVVYDLENRIEVSQGLQNATYSSVVEGYFEVDTLSEELRAKFDRYKALFHKDSLESCDYAELARLENYLDEIPDYLDVSFSSEYNRMKLEFLSRG